MQGATCLMLLLGVWCSLHPSVELCNVMYNETRTPIRGSDPEPKSDVIAVLMRVSIREEFVADSEDASNCQCGCAPQILDRAVLEGAISDGMGWPRLDADGTHQQLQQVDDAKGLRAANDSRRHHKLRRRKTHMAENKTHGPFRAKYSGGTEMGDGENVTALNEPVFCEGQMDAGNDTCDSGALRLARNRCLTYGARLVLATAMVLILLYLVASKVKSTHYQTQHRRVPMRNESYLSEELDRMRFIALLLKRKLFNTDSKTPAFDSLKEHAIDEI